MKLGCKEVLETKATWRDSTNGRNGSCPNSSNQMIHEVGKLEDLLPFASEVRPLGDGCRIGGNGSVGHAVMGQ